MEIGLVVQYDGKENYVLQDGVHRYPIGGILFEYARLAPSELIDIILSCPNKEKKTTRHEIVIALEYIRKTCAKQYGVVISVMFIAELFETIDNLLGYTPKEIMEHLKELTLDERFAGIKKYILDKNETEEFNVETIGGMLSYAYFIFGITYSTFKATFIELNKSIEHEKNKDVEVNEQALEKFLSMYGENFDAQQIDYKVMLIDGKFSSVYTLQNSFSLLLFEVAHLIETGQRVTKCKNCGNYFVPETRSDTLYCNYPSPQNKEKTCKVNGAQVARAKKEKSDSFTREYRRAYMRLKMKARRNPNRVELGKMLKEMVAEAKEWRDKINENNIDEEAWKEWLSHYS